jgi:glycine/D-amino acid oxidase-like deaminating enzyme
MSEVEEAALADYRRLIERAARALADALSSAEAEELEPVLDPEPCP